MLVTEEQAREKQCPLSFAVPEQRDANGCGIRQGGPWGCIGSACMAWRWHGPDYSRVNDALDGDRIIDAIREYRAVTGSTLKDSKDACVAKRETGLRFPHGGYCGAFGRPE